MLLMTSQRPGVSALSLMRLLGLPSYQTAWTWLHKLRRAMVRPGREPLTGKVEVDDGYVGGEETGVHGRETKNKAVVAVAVEVKGQAAGRLYNRRSSGRVTLPLQRLCAIAALTAPVTYRRIVDEPQLLGAA